MSIGPEAVLVGMIAIFVIIILIDVILAMDKTKGNTYSEILRAAGKKWIALIMMITFGMGLLAGHWWWGTG